MSGLTRLEVVTRRFRELRGGFYEPLTIARGKLCAGLCIPMCDASHPHSQLAPAPGGWDTTAQPQAVKGGGGAAAPPPLRLAIALYKFWRLIWRFNMPLAAAAATAAGA
jgi:hypothetical protein